MARYIDADALLDSLMGYKKYISIQFGELEMLGCDVVKQCIDSAPTADVVDRKKLIQKYHDYQIEWLTSHCDLEFEQLLESWIVRYLHDTANMFILEVER